MPPRTTTELVGRHEEVARVLDALGWVDGGGGAVLLGGDAGIGKTAVVGHVARLGAGRRILVGHCVGEGSTSLPYLPFVEMFAGLDARDRELVDELVATHPGLVPLVPRVASGARGDAVRADLVEAVHGALADLGRRGPLLVVVEDVHWADESTRELLTLLFTRGLPDGVALLVTYRSDDVHRRHPLAGALALWSRLPGLTRIDLGPLPDPDLRRIVRRAGTGLSDDLVERVAHRAEGNAFFAEELAAAAGERGGADPGDLARLLLTRVDRLDDEAQGVVRVAAVIGRRVRHALLERVAGVDAATLGSALRAAVEHHVLEPWGERGYEFRHALLAEAVTDDLLPAERLQLHRLCVEALRADPGLGSSADLARHALAAGDHAVALEASVLAGDAARRMGGPAEALAHYETALTLADADPASGHDLTLRAAAAAMASGRTARGMAFLRARLDTDLPTPHERAELISALVLAARMTEGHLDRLSLTEQALGLLADDAPVGLRVGLLTRRAEALMDDGDSAQALTVADEAMSLAVEHDLTVDRTDLASVLARLSETAGDPGESIRRLERAVAAWTTEPDVALLRAMYVLASVHYRLADHPAALAAFERTAAEARRAGLEWSAYGLDARAMAVTVAYEMGQWDHALQIGDHTTDVAIPSWAAASIDAAAGLVLAGRGETTAADLLATSRPWWSEEGRIAVQSGAAALDVLGHDGDIDAVLELHTELVTFLRELWGEGRVAAEVRLAGLVLGHLGTTLRSGAHAHGRRAELLTHADRLCAEAATVFGAGSLLHPPSLEGRAWSARVDAEHERVRWAAGDDVAVDGLVDRWRDVVDLFVEHGDPYEVARSRWRLAEVLLAAGDKQGDEMLQLAREAARELGAVPLTEALDRLAPRSRPRTTTSTLTAREAEVLALVAEGRSNGEIGRALFISTKTASVHVSNILAKLGAASRGEAVAVARAGGLLDD